MFASVNVEISCQHPPNHGWYFPFINHLRCTIVKLIIINDWHNSNKRKSENINVLYLLKQTGHPLTTIKHGFLPFPVIWILDWNHHFHKQKANGEYKWTLEMDRDRSSDTSYPPSLFSQNGDLFQLFTLNKQFN